MYQLLIVDDELSTRKWLTKMIDWQKLGFIVVAVVKDGMEAWKVIQQEPSINIVLTDIRMPKLDGIELLHKIKNFSSSNKEVVFLSGYADFDYAKEAIQYGALEYILKPLKRDTLEDAMQKVRTKLDKKLLREGQIMLARQYKIEQESQKRQAILTRWLVEKARIPDLKLQLPSIFQNTDHSNYVLITCEIDNFKVFSKKYSREDQRLCSFMIMNILREVGQNHYMLDSFYLERNSYLLLLKPDLLKNVNTEFLINICRNIHEAMCKFLKLFDVTVTVAASGVATSIQQFPKLFDETMIALKQKFVKGNNSYYIYTEESNTNIEINYPIKMEKRIVKALKQGELKEGVYLFRQFSTNVAKINDGNKIKLMVSGLLLNITKELREVKSLPIPWAYINELIDELNEVETLEVLQEKAIKLIHVIIHSIKEDAIENSPIVKGIEYMKLKFNRDISLKEVSDYVGVSQSYFSIQFKKEKGQNFVDYLCSIRMEKAMELLEKTNKTVAEISDEIGYQSYRYFTKVFKEFAGVTPTQYRGKVKNII